MLHMVEFGVLASLLYLALRKMNTAKHHLFTLAFVIAFLYGVSDEIHQYFVPGRRADVFDVIANGIGAFCFLRVIQILSYQPSALSRQSSKPKNIIRQDLHD
jgi:glycopeptide antibiotics resistance protein